jgi:hypothetical protein
MFEIISIKEKLIPIKFRDDEKESVAEYMIKIEILTIVYEPLYSITIFIPNEKT